MQHGDPLRDLADESDVVLDDDDGQAARVEVLKHCRRSAGLLRRHAGRGFVEQQEVGSGRQNHGDLQPLELVMREFLRRHFAVRIEPEPIEREAIALVSIGRPISSHDLQDGVEILPHGKTMKGAIGLKRQADARGARAEMRASA